MIELLRRARERISVPERWCQYTGSLDRGGHPVDAADENAVCWCALAAIGKEAAVAGLFDPKTMDRNTMGDVYPGQWALIRWLDTVAVRLFGDGWRTTKMQDVNDYHGRLAAILVFDAAIEDLAKGVVIPGTRR
jgi:hypothetical protein